MNKILYIILFYLFGITSIVSAQTFTQNGMSDTFRKNIENSIFGDTGREIGITPFFTPYLTNNLEYFLQIILTVDPAIDSIRYDGSTVSLYGDYQKRFVREGGYGNLYNQYHDIYSSLFSFKEVDAVSVWDCWDDCRNVTYIPIKSDEYAVRVENAVFKRSWYIPDLDYYHLLEANLEHVENYDDYGDFRSGVLESLISSTDVQTQEKQYKIYRKALDVGAYDYNKVKKKKNSYKIYYDQEAEEKFSVLLMSDERLRSVNTFGEYIRQEDGSTVFFRELEAIEYCPELNYVLLTGGHGYVFIYDLITLKEIYTNPSTHIYSPTEKYRFGTFLYEGVNFYIEIKEGKNYVPYLLAWAESEDYITGIYWHDDKTMHYLKEKKSADGSKYWIGYSAKLCIVSENE